MCIADFHSCRGDDDDDDDDDDALDKDDVVHCTAGCQAILVTLERDENGLGFTIAGGHGSTPYRGNDQVRVRRLRCVATLPCEMSVSLV